MYEPDFSIENHGSVCILVPISEPAQGWVEEHILVEGNEVQRWGKNGIVIEPRYVGAIVEGFQSEGLTV